MAWNRSSAESAPVKKKGGAPSSAKGILIGLAIAVPLVALCLWLFSGGDDAPKAKPDKERGRIKEVTPAPAPVAKAVAEGEKEPPKPRGPQKVGESRDGWIKLPNGRLIKDTGAIHCAPARLSLEDQVFDRSTDRSIANLLTVEPGTMFIGDSSMYYKNFTEKFLESLKEPIIITHDDSEEVKMLKQGVIDARKELKARYDAGEDLGAVMRETREQMRELGLYREELEQQVREIVKTKDELTDSDLKDLLGAANKMLEERGVKPIHLDAAFAYQIRSKYMEKQQDENND